MAIAKQEMVAVVILTHFFNEVIQQFHDRLRREMPEGYRIFVHINQPAGETNPPPGCAGMGDGLSLGNDDQLIAMGYPNKCAAIQADGLPWSLPGNNDLPMLDFWRSHPGFDHYWGIEYDVHYQGNWKRLFEHFASSQADLLATVLHNAADIPRNRLDPEYRGPDGIPPSLCDTIRGFYPLYRITARGLSAIDAAYRAGWSGHYEMGWANYILAAGGTIEDIGGNGPYVKPENRNRFYFSSKRTFTKSPGTFVFRPSFQSVPARYENTLWHPVKPDGDYGLWFSLIDPRGGLKAIVEKLKPIMWLIVVRLWFMFVWRRLV